MFKVQTWNSPWKSIDWSQSIISTNQALQNSMEVRLSNRNWRLLFQHASSAILKRQTAARWSNTRGGRAKCIKLILCMWKTLRSQYYFSILKPTWKVKLAIPVLLEQEHLSVQNYRNFEWRINEKTLAKVFAAAISVRRSWRHCLQGAMVRMTSFTRGLSNFHTKYCTCVVFIEALFRIKQVYIYQVGTSKNRDLLIYMIEVR